MRVPVADHAPGGPAENATSYRRRRLTVTTGLLLLAAVVASSVAIPAISMSGDPVVVRKYDLDRGPRGAVYDRTVDRSPYGFVIRAHSAGTVTLPIPVHLAGR